MNYYFDLAEAAFNSHPILTILYCIPASILLILSILAVVIAFSGPPTRGPGAGNAEAILILLGFFFGFLFLISLFFTLKWDHINLKPQYAKSIAENLYAKKLEDIYNDSQSAFFILSNNRKHMNDFRKNLLLRIPSGVTLYNKDINEHLQPLYINCMEQSKIKYLQNIKDEISINQIEHSIMESQNICAVSASKNLIESNVWNKYKEKVVPKSVTL